MVTLTAIGMSGIGPEANVCRPADVVLFRVRQATSRVDHIQVGVRWDENSLLSPTRMMMRQKTMPCGYKLGHNGWAKRRARIHNDRSYLSYKRLAEWHREWRKG